MEPDATDYTINPEDDQINSESQPEPAKVSTYVACTNLSKGLREALLQEYMKNSPNTPKEVYMVESISELCKELAFLVVEDSNNSVRWNAIAEIASKVNTEINNK